MDITIALVQYCVIGILAGLLAGLLGVGGGIIVVPCLAYVFSNQNIPHDSLMHVVAGTSLAAMIVTTLFSLRGHYQRGIIFWPLFTRLLPGIMLGTMAGTVLARFLDTHVLRILFGLFVLVIAIRMFFQEHDHVRHKFPGPLGRWSAALFIGMSSGMLGIGGSTLSIPFLTYFNISMRNAMAISTACGFIVAVTGTIGFIIVGWHQTDMPHWSTGYIYWPAALGVALGSPLFTLWGASLSHRLPVETLRRIFSVFLFVIGLQMLIY